MRRSPSRSGSPDAGPAYPTRIDVPAPERSRRGPKVAYGARKMAKDNRLTLDLQSLRDDAQYCYLALETSYHPGPSDNAPRLRKTRSTLPRDAANEAEQRRRRNKRAERESAVLPVPTDPLTEGSTYRGPIICVLEGLPPNLSIGEIWHESTVDDAPFWFRQRPSRNAHFEVVWEQPEGEVMPSSSLSSASPDYAKWVRRLGRSMAVRLSAVYTDGSSDDRIDPNDEECDVGV